MVVGYGAPGLQQDVKSAWMSSARPLAGAFGVPMPYLASVAQNESGNRNIPSNIGGSSAFGPFQFLSGTWADVSRQHPELNLTPQDRFSPQAQGVAMVAFTADNASKLESALGRKPTTAELGLAHRFGAGGAIALLRSPRRNSVAAVLPDAAGANPQWSNLTVDDILKDTQKYAGGGGFENVKGDSGLAPSSPTSPLTSGGGLAELFGGGNLAPQPYGSQLQNITPEFRQILQIALNDPTLGPSALETLLHIGMQGGPGGAGGAGGALKPTPEIINAIASNYPVGSPEWNRLVGKAPAEPNTVTDAQKDAAALGYKVGSPEYNAYIEQRTLKPGVKVDINTPSSPNPVVQEDFKAVMDEGRAAFGDLNDVTRMRTALKNVPTGVGQDLRAKAQLWVKALGFDPSIIGQDISSPAQIISALQVPLALRVRQAGTGQMSDAEQRLYMSAVPSLGNTPEANEFLLDTMELIAKRKVEARRFAEKYAKANGGLTIDLPDALDTWRESHPIYDEAFIKKWEPKIAAGAGAGANAPTATTSPNPATSAAPAISTKDEYDALPSGAPFTWNGKPGRKP